MGVWGHNSPVIAGMLGCSSRSEKSIYSGVTVFIGIQYFCMP